MCFWGLDLGPHGPTVPTPNLLTSVVWVSEGQSHCPQPFSRSLFLIGYLALLPLTAKPSAPSLILLSTLRLTSQSNQVFKEVWVRKQGRLVPPAVEGGTQQATFSYLSFLSSVCISNSCSPFYSLVTGSSSHLEKTFPECRKKILNQHRGGRGLSRS